MRLTGVGAVCRSDRGRKRGPCAFGLCARGGPVPWVVVLARRPFGGGRSCASHGVPCFSRGVSLIAALLSLLCGVPASKMFGRVFVGGTAVGGAPPSAPSWRGARSDLRQQFRSPERHRRTERNGGHGVERRGRGRRSAGGLPVALSIRGVAGSGACFPAVAFRSERCSGASSWGVRR